ncbi:hypothetical protein OPKNFCMD_3850 [Methylobacterium crusticola]|uniref:Uncharacterized protein n=1 Tax=Methylobacterium crusticola TaxID=1697972 RepID=A0ABQ4R1R9_9HYPH|nr:hypothetical protein [Methylobacterium crusticola]GJD51099.1 hypothetical protein OPKNFCMD_3850 [Methylobacterium crusticola]
MGCACAERRTALVEGARALLRGDARSAAQGARRIGQSLAQDAAALARQIEQARRRAR